MALLLSPETYTWTYLTIEANKPSLPSFEALAAGLGKSSTAFSLSLIVWYSNGLIFLSPFCKAAAKLSVRAVYNIENHLIERSRICSLNY